MSDHDCWASSEVRDSRPIPGGVRRRRECTRCGRRWSTKELDALPRLRRTGGPRSAPLRGVHAGVRALAESADDRGLKYETLGRRAGVTGHAVRGWIQRGRDPGVSSLEAALNVVGLTLRVGECARGGGEDAGDRRDASGGPSCDADSR